MKNYFVAIIFIICSCSSQEWKGGRIIHEGVYEKNNLKIIVKDKDWKLSYFMLASNGDTLIKSKDEFSILHRWSLHLDENQNLWVFSSDIGNSCWVKGDNKYIKHEFMKIINIDSVPHDVSETLSEFYPYNRK